MRDKSNLLSIYRHYSKHQCKICHDHKNSLAQKFTPKLIKQTNKNNLKCNKHKCIEKNVQTTAETLVVLMHFNFEHISHIF